MGVVLWLEYRYNKRKIGENYEQNKTSMGISAS